jgi:peptidoglycan/LPS O-acetylase OafA/YrhL
VTPLFFLSAGVDCFFVISGFVMVYSSSAMFATPKAGVAFLLKRLARIVPMYWMTTAVWLWLAAPTMTLSSIAGSFLFYPYREASGQIVPIYGVGWTLNYEMFFYCLFAAVMFLPRQVAVAVLCVILLALVMVGRWLPAAAPFEFWTDPIILEFALGMLIAHLHLSGMILPTWVRCAVAIIAAIAIWSLAPYWLPSNRLIIWGLPAAAIIAMATLGKHDLVRGTIAAPTANVLGNASYAIYLTHGLVANALFVGWQQGLYRFNLRLLIFVGPLLAIAISIAIYYLFERGATRFLRNRLWPTPPRVAR